MDKFIVLILALVTAGIVIYIMPWSVILFIMIMVAWSVILFIIIMMAYVFVREAS